MKRIGPGSIVAFLDVIACGFGAVVLIILIAPVGESKGVTEPEVYDQLSRLVNRADELAAVEKITLGDIKSSEKKNK